MAIAARSEVIGSLLRPDYLSQAREQLERGELDPAGFKRLEDRAVDEAIALQEAAGIDVITDGLQQDRELGLLLGRRLGFGSGASSGRSSRRDRCSGLDTELVFNGLDSLDHI